MLKRIVFWVTGVALLVLVAWFGWNHTPDSTVVKNEPKLQYLGILDSSDNHWNTSNFEYLHSFIAWGKNVDESLKVPLDHIKQTTKKIMITIEPWPDLGQSGSQMHEAIIKGDYDSRMQELCTKIAEASEAPIIRWGHEMDLVGNTWYPWAIEDRQLFIKSFQRMSSVCKKTSKKILFMWSPAGIPKSVEYYPGSQYIDIIGLSIFGYPAYEQKNFGKPFTFDDVLAPRYRTVSQYKLPIMIAELSVSGDESYKQQWLNNCFEKLKNPNTYPLLRGFAYFDASGVEAWEPGIDPPDFTINPDILIDTMNKYNIHK